MPAACSDPRWCVFISTKTELRCHSRSNSLSTVMKAPVLTSHISTLWLPCQLRVVSQWMNSTPFSVSALSVSDMTLKQEEGVSGMTWKVIYERGKWESVPTLGSLQDFLPQNLKRLVRSQTGEMLASRGWAKTFFLTKTVNLISSSWTHYLVSSHLVR